jgi:hypothetical protein
MPCWFREIGQHVMDAASLRCAGPYAAPPLRPLISIIGSLPGRLRPIPRSAYWSAAEPRFAALNLRTACQRHSFARKSLHCDNGFLQLALLFRSVPTHLFSAMAQAASAAPLDRAPIVLPALEPRDRNSVAAIVLPAYSTLTITNRTIPKAIP